MVLPQLTPQLMPLALISISLTSAARAIRRVMSIK